MTLRLGSYAIVGHHEGFVAAGQFAERLEELGADLIGVGDSPGIFRDPYVSLAVLSQRVTRARLATLVTNPVLRHPVASANAIGSISELTEGRAVLGVGTGDSAVHNIGAEPATLATLEAHVRAVRGLLTTGEVDWCGTTLWMKWRPPPVPIFIAASGPRTLRLAGRVADGVVIATGVDRESATESLRHLNQGAAEAGRDPESIEVWWSTITSAADTREDAIREVAFALAARAHHTFRAGVRGRRVPAELAAQLTRLVTGYRTREHSDHSAVHNDGLVNDSGLGDFLARRFGVIGTPDECRDQLVAAAGWGVRNILTSLHGRSGFSVHPFVTEVIPAASAEVLRSESARPGQVG